MTRRPGATTRPGRHRSDIAAPRPRAHPAVEIGQALAKPCLKCAKYLLPFVLLIIVGVGAFYARILYGPISLKVLAEPIARSIAAEMQGVGVSIEDALVRLNEQGEVEFRLRNVQLLDEQGSPVAIAPLAAVELSVEGLWSARLSPESVVLIEPRLLLAYSEEHGVSFSFTRPDGGQPTLSGDSGGAPAPASERLTPSDISDPGLPVVLRQLDLARVIAEASERARQRSDATSFLRQIGMQNATLVIEHEGHQSVWRVPQADLSLSHRKQRSVIEGSVTVASSRGPWTLQVWTEASGKTEQVHLKASVRDLVPRAVAGMLPALEPLRALDVPVHGEVSLQLTSAGKLLDGAFSLDLSRGDLRLPWLPDLPLTIEGGRLDLNYDPVARTLRMEPSTLVWGQSRVTATGDVVSSTGPDGEEVWAYRLSALDGVVMPEGGTTGPVKIDRWLAEGSFQPDTGALTIAQRLTAGGGEVRLSGKVGPRHTGSRISIEGQIGSMPVATVRGLWPRALASNTRDWVNESFVRGQVQGGTLKFDSGSEMAGGNEPQRLSLALQTADVLLRPTPDLPPIEVPRALLRIEGVELEATIPEAAMLLASGRKLALKSGRVTVADVFADDPIGHIVMTGEGSVLAGIELLEHDIFRLGRLSGPYTERVEGKVEAQIALTLPLEKDVKATDVKIEGRGKLTDGRVRKLVGRHDVQAATIAFSFTDKAVDARGDMMLSGVPVKIAWHNIFDAPPERQPPLRLTSTLDSADRAQLGIEVGHLIHGEVPIEMTITRDANEQYRIHVWADLTRADMVVENIAWRKPPGRNAAMQFDVHQVGARNDIELRDFKIVGDNIAISGWMKLDQNEKLREFQFPEFSTNVVTRLEVKGALRTDNVWEIVAQGQTYDGRDVFRSLFSVGDLADQPLEERQTAPGVDLKVDIATVIGFSDVSLRGLTMRLSRRDGKLTALKAHGTLDGGKPLDVELQRADKQRRLVAVSEDAGQAFRLIDFYPSLVGGRMRLDVNLEGRGAAEKTGLLRVERFRILGDPVVAEVLQVHDETRPYEQRRQRVVRQAIDFDWMRVPFSVGHGQFVMGDGEIRGPLVGATMRGKADFRTRQVNIGGTYVPLQGLNSAIGVIPGLGQILAGPRGEGILGITFAIQGSMSDPQVLVNPLSLVAPGIFREMFQMTPSQSVTPPRPAPQQPSAGQRSSSAPAAPASKRRTGAVEPEVLSGWSSETNTGNAPKKK